MDVSVVGCGVLWKRRYACECCGLCLLLLTPLIFFSKMILLTPKGYS